MLWILWLIGWARALYLSVFRRRTFATPCPSTLIFATLVDTNMTPCRSCQTRCSPCAQSAMRNAIVENSRRPGFSSKGLAGMQRIFATMAPKNLLLVGIRRLLAATLRRRAAAMPARRNRLLDQAVGRAPLRPAVPLQRARRPAPIRAPLKAPLALVGRAVRALAQPPVRRVHRPAVNLAPQPSADLAASLE